MNVQCLVFEFSSEFALADNARLDARLIRPDGEGVALGFAEALLSQPEADPDVD